MLAPKGSPSAVVFDFYGTLTPSTPDDVWAEHAARSADPIGIEPDAWRAALDRSFPDRATGRLGDLPATFRILALRLGVVPPEEDLMAACAARLASQRELFVLRPEAADTLAKLRERRIRTGVLSDCTVELETSWPELPLAGMVDARVLSCEEGRRKPDPELFRLIAERLGVKPEDCLYVGDGGGHELTGASGVGMHAYQLKAADWAENNAHSREDDWAGPTLDSLGDVLSLL